jgi:hypothetical protein
MSFPSSSRARGILVAALLLLGMIPAALVAADPPSATVGPASPAAHWEGPDRTAKTDGETDGQCTADNADPIPDGYCDDFFLDVSPEVDGNYLSTHQTAIDIQVLGIAPGEDVDVYVYDVNGTEVASSGNPGGAEIATIDCPSAAAAPYKVRVVYFVTLDDGVAATPGYSADASFSSTEGTCTQEADGGTATFVDDGIAFGPAAIVSTQFLGSEPQVTIERRHPNTPASAGIDPSRVFIDWPLSSRSGIGQLHRSLDGGETFRVLFDPLCANRSRPNCATSGGGDTENDVNPISGHLFFSDQEVLANEALAMSADHGDSFIAQTAAANGTTGTDRQWIAATDSTATIAGTDRVIEGFLVYHVSPSHYIQAIDATGLPIAQPVPQLTNVAQSGQPRVDNNPGSPGHGWIYQPYIGSAQGGGTWVATAPSARYALPTEWHPSRVTASSTTSFPWVSIDAAGNAYLVWDTGGAIYYSFSRIDDPANDPRDGGIPGTSWSPRVKVSAPQVGSAVFGEVIAGDAGRIAIAYDGTEMFTGEPDDAGEDVLWNTYAAVIPNALAATPSVYTGRVSHRSIHMGDVCTGGLGCTTDTTADRSLLDMIDLSFDESGRVGVVFTDNYSTFQEMPLSEDETPFTHFARQVAGPSVLASRGTVAVSIPAGHRSDPAGDATWPNRAGAANLPALDATEVAIAMENGDVVARLSLADPSAAAMARDLAAYNAASGALNCEPATSCLADRLQYVVRFSSATELYHLSADFTPGSGLRFFGGRLDANDKVVAEASPTATFAAGYHTDSGVAVTGSIEGSTLVLRAPASAFGLQSGDPLFSVTGFTAAGPSEATEITIGRIMRTVDATPPADATLTNVITGPDLAVSDLRAGGSTAPKGGDKVAVTAVITNGGTRPAAASKTEITVDGKVLATLDTPALAAGASATVSATWDTRGLNGEHVLVATADRAATVTETREDNNLARRTVNVRGNKVSNGSFETPSSSGNGPAAWTASSGGAGTTSWSQGGIDGSRAATISGNGGSVVLAGMPTWTSDPVAVTGGQVLTLRVAVSAASTSSAPSVGLAYLGAAGQVLDTVRLIEVPTLVSGFTVLETDVTVPAGVATVRVVLSGFAPTDTATRGSVTFDEVGLYGP